MALAVACGAALVAGLSGGATASTTTTVPTPTQPEQAALGSETVKVVGHIFGEGLGSTQATPITQVSVRIKVVAHKHVVATTTTTNGEFSFRLRPGTYRLEAYVGKGTVCEEEELTVQRNAHVITVRLTCVAR